MFFYSAPHATQQGGCLSIRSVNRGGVSFNIMDSQQGGDVKINTDPIKVVLRVLALFIYPTTGDHLHATGQIFSFIKVSFNETIQQGGVRRVWCRIKNISISFLYILTLTTNYVIKNYYQFCIIASFSLVL